MAKASNILTPATASAPAATATAPTALGVSKAPAKARPLVVRNRKGSTAHPVAVASSQLRLLWERMLTLQGTAYRAILSRSQLVPTAIRGNGAWADRAKAISAWGDEVCSVALAIRDIGASQPGANIRLSDPADGSLFSANGSQLFGSLTNEGSRIARSKLA